MIVRTTTTCYHGKLKAAAALTKLLCCGAVVRHLGHSLEHGPMPARQTTVSGS